MRILLQEAFTKALYFKGLHKISDFERTQIISIHYQIVSWPKAGIWLSGEDWRSDGVQRSGTEAELQSTDSFCPQWQVF